MARKVGGGRREASSCPLVRLTCPSTEHASSRLLSLPGAAALSICIIATTAFAARERQASDTTLSVHTGAANTANAANAIARHGRCHGLPRTCLCGRRQMERRSSGHGVRHTSAAGARTCVTILRSLAHRGGHRRPVLAFSFRCRTAVACSRGRVRRSLRTPVRHAASGQLVGVNRATARSAAVRPVAARATVCGHGVRGRVLGSVVPAVAMALLRTDGPVSSLGGCHVTLLVSVRHRFTSLCVGGSDARVQRLPVFKNGKSTPK